MFAFTNPSRLAGFIGLAGLLVAAEAGGAGDGPARVRDVACRSCSCSASSQARHSGAPGVSMTLLGLDVDRPRARRTRCMLRDLPHGDKIVIIVLVGTFVGDTAAYLGGRAFGERRLAPSISPNKTVEGLAIGIVMAIAGVWFAGPVRRLAVGRRGARARRGGRGRRAAGRPLRVLPQAGRRARRTPAACSARTAARWTGSTPCCSRRWRGSTCGRRCCRALAVPRSGRTNATHRKSARNSRGDRNPSHRRKCPRRAPRASERDAVPASRNRFAPRQKFAQVPARGRVPALTRSQVASAPRRGAAAAGQRAFTPAPRRWQGAGCPVA